MTAPVFPPALAMAAKSSDGDAAPDVDLMILDFLLYKATEALLAERAADKDGGALEDHERPELPLQMVDCTFLVPAASSSCFPSFSQREKPHTQKCISQN